MRTFGKTVIILCTPEAKSRQQMVYTAFVSQTLQDSFWLKIRINCILICCFLSLVIAILEEKEKRKIELEL